MPYGTAPSRARLLHPKSPEAKLRRLMRADAEAIKAADKAERSQAMRDGRAAKERRAAGAV
jgi:hypothetical protein